MENRRFTMTYLSSHFPKISKIFRSLLHKIVTEHILFRKLSARWVPKQLTPEHKAKRMESALELLQRYYDDGEFLDRITTVMKRGSHKLPQKPSSNQSIGVWVDLPTRRNSSRLCRRGEWCAWYSGTDGAFSSSTSWQEVRRWILSVIANHCRNWDGPFRTSDVWCSVPVLSFCTITLGHTRLDGHHISYRSSAGRCLIIHTTARTSRPQISIFSCTSKNSCPVSVFRMAERRRWVSHSGSIPMWQTSTTQEKKSWSYGMTNFSVPVVNMLKIDQHLVYLFH